MWTTSPRCRSGLRHVRREAAFISFSSTQLPALYPSIPPDGCFEAALMRLLSSRSRDSVKAAANSRRSARRTQAAARTRVVLAQEPSAGPVWAWVSIETASKGRTVEPLWEHEELLRRPGMWERPGTVPADPAMLCLYPFDEHQSYFGLRPEQAPALPSPASHFAEEVLQSKEVDEG